MSLPRIERSARSDSFVRSRPWYVTEPPTTRPARGSRPRVASDVTLLPHPDSPTMPSVSPGAMSKLMPLTACTVPRPVRKLTRRSDTSSSGSLADAKLGVEGLTQAVSDQVEGKAGDHDRRAGDEGEVRRGLQEADGAGQHRPPLRRRRVLRPEAEE